MKVGEWNVLKMIVFRENMGSRLFLSTANRIFGSKQVAQLDERIKRLLVSEPKNLAVARKLEYAKQNAGIFQVFDFVRFVGVSGSVAAGFSNEDDDIDIFIVVRNGTGWLYRGLLLVRNLFSGKIRMGGGYNKRHTGLGSRFRDKFCINLIVEERGLDFDQDIFIFHELLHVIPLYNEEYLRRILARNSWISKFGAVAKVGKKMKTERAGILTRLINNIFFLAQLIYRVLMLHPTDLREILGSYKQGKIAFYPADFKREILNRFESKYERKVLELFGNKGSK